jgi:hypothetical protein
VSEAAPQSRDFFLSAEDPETRCDCLEARFKVQNLGELVEILDASSSDDPSVDRFYWLDDEQLGRIRARFGVALDPGERDVRLEGWHFHRGVPYLVHTNFELPLMLEGLKPLAIFSDSYPCDWLADLEGLFAPYVESGRFVRRVVDEPFAEDSPWRRNGAEGVRQLYYALPTETWRIDAYIVLRKVAAATGWNDTLERFQGALLGYEDWQCDWWAANHKQTWASPRR